MAIRSYNGTNRWDPEAHGQCDRCARVRLRKDLVKEMIQAGTRLAWNGLIVCPTCLDKPHPQDRTIRLKPDPMPVKLPRPEQ